MEHSLMLKLQRQYNKEIEDTSHLPYKKRFRLLSLVQTPPMKDDDVTTPTINAQPEPDVSPYVPTKKRSRRVSKTRQLDGDRKHRKFVNKKVEPDSVHENMVMLESMVSHIKNNLKYEEVSDAKMILKKRLQRSDLLNNQAQLSIPANRLLTSFLTKDEEVYLKQKLENKKNTKIDVKVIMDDSVYMLSLSRWNYHDKNNNNNNNNNEVGWKYVLKNGWTRLKDDKKLEEGDIIRIVSFRSNNQLHLAIIGPENLNLLDASS